MRVGAELQAFAHHWDFRPRACTLYRARTKGKDDYGIGYVKKNAVAAPRNQNLMEISVS
ncbi:hypothetical protein GCM10028812_52560 [Ancylobacter sonchi]